MTENSATREVLLAIDQGTSSSRAIAFAPDGTLIATEQQAFEQLYPASGWVEHDAEVIWATVLSTTRTVLDRLRAKNSGSVTAVGITNQRETTVVWDRRTGAPIHNAIVWQDRRTADRCRKLAEAGHEAEVAKKTGLLLDPYFSATKLAWILDKVAGARELPSVPSTASSSGASPAVGCTSPTPRMPAARPCSTFVKVAGMKACASCSMCR
jgi:glycerol kinase